MPLARATRYTPVLVFVGSMALAVAATLGFHFNAVERDQTRFQQAARSLEHRIGRRLDGYVAMLLGARGLFAASQHVGPDEFRAYVESTEVQRRYPGTQGVGFSARVPPGERERFEAEQRARDPEFRIWPPGDRDELHSIIYLEPLDAGNRAAIGFDMFSEKVRRDAMEQARDTGVPTATARVTLVQESALERTQPGFLIYVPVYDGMPQTVEERRRQLLGFVYSPFRTGDLIAGILGSQLGDVDFDIYQGTEPSHERRLHTTGLPDPEHPPSFVSVARIDVAGGPWTLVFRSRPTFEDYSARRATPYLFIAGCLISLALLGITWVQVRRRSAAEAAERERGVLLDREKAARSEAELQRNQLRRSEQNFRFLAESVPQLVWTATPTGSVDYCNQRWTEYTGTNIEEILEHGWASAVHPEDRDGLLAAWSTATRSGQPYEGICRLRRHDGSYRWFIARATPLCDEQDRIVKWFGTTTDIDDLRQAVRVRDDFMSIAGHELRTPLTALQLQLQGILRQAEKGGFGSLPERLIDRLRKGAAQVERLEALIRELLDVSRIASGRLTLKREQLELVPLVQEVTERFSEQAARAGSPLRVHVQNEPSGRWDRTRLDQVLTNLVSNAIKYGAGRPIDVRVNGDQHEAWIEVRDHGIGIANEDRERIFGRFERAVSERNYGGLGLGLWISRQITDALGGTISVDSTPGQGTTFMVRLPRWHEDSEPALPAAELASSA